MKVLIVEPGKHPYEADIEPKLETYQKLVGGYIEAIYPYDDPVGLICEEEALFHPEQKWNRVIDYHTVIKGIFFICGLGEEDFTDLTPELMEKYKKLFWEIVHFLPTKDGLVPVVIREQGKV